MNRFEYNSINAPVKGVKAGMSFTSIIGQRVVIKKRISADKWLVSYDGGDKKLMDVEVPTYVILKTLETSEAGRVKVSYE